MKTQTAPQIKKRTDRQDFQRVLLQRRIKKEECKHAINKNVRVELFTEKKIGTFFYFSKKEPTNHYSFDDPRTTRVYVRLKPNYRGPACLIPKDAVSPY